MGRERTVRFYKRIAEQPPFRRGRTLVCAANTRDKKRAAMLPEADIL